MKQKQSNKQLNRDPSGRAVLPAHLQQSTQLMNQQRKTAQNNKKRHDGDGGARAVSAKDYYFVDKPCASYAAFAVPAGQVDLARLTDPNWEQQLDAFFRRYGLIGKNNRARKISMSSLDSRRTHVFSSFRLLMRDRRLHTLSQVKPRHIQRLLQLWTQQEISPRSQKNYFSSLRWFWRMCGIAVKDIENYSDTHEDYRIRCAATRDKSWAGNGVDFEKVVKQMYQLDSVGARLLTVMRTFGLSMKEALCMQPHEVDQGNTVVLTKGTKSGKHRQIDLQTFDSGLMRQVLNEMKEQVRPEQHLAWENLSLQQARWRLNYLCRKVGLTKKQLGVTLHGLRHQWAHEKLQDLIDVRDPVLGGKPIDYRTLSGARQQIFEAMGHHRISVTSTYYGSFAAQNQAQAIAFVASWEKLAACLPEIVTLLNSCRVDNLYVCGIRAQGDKTMHNAAFELLLPAGVPASEALLVSRDISDIVTSSTGCPCFVHSFDALGTSMRQHMDQHAIPLFIARAPGHNVSGTFLC